LNLGGTKIKQMISPQSIRKGIIIKFDGVEVDKATIIKASEEWKESHEILFKKLLKQGGSFKINGVLVSVLPLEKALNSKGEMTINLPPCDPFARF
jgi:translation elongation factor P/translation initiation factor 5A